MSAVGWRRNLLKTSNGVGVIQYRVHRQVTGRNGRQAATEWVKNSNSEEQLSKGGRRGKTREDWHSPVRSETRHGGWSETKWLIAFSRRWSSHLMSSVAHSAFGKRSLYEGYDKTKGGGIEEYSVSTRPTTPDRSHYVDHVTYRRGLMKAKIPLQYDCTEGCRIETAKSFARRLRNFLVVLATNHAVCISTSGVCMTNGALLSESVIENDGIHYHTYTISGRELVNTSLYLEAVLLRREWNFELFLECNMAKYLYFPVFGNLGKISHNRRIIFPMQYGKISLVLNWLRVYPRR